jgi:hypothetical protein
MKVLSDRQNAASMIEAKEAEWRKAAEAAMARTS